MTFAELLRKRLDKLLMPRTECALRLGITRQAVHRHLKGEDIPSVRTLNGYARVLGVDNRKIFDAVAESRREKEKKKQKSSPQRR